MLRQMLESLGYTTECKKDGKAALGCFAEETAAGRAFAAIILDLTIPGGMGGVDTVAEIRKTNKTIPVFVASGYSDDPVMMGPGDYGFTASFPKPFTLEELSDLLNKYLSV